MCKFILFFRSIGLLVDTLYQRFRIPGLCAIAAYLLLISPALFAVEEDDFAKSAYVGADLSFARLDVEGVSYSPITARARLGIDILVDVQPKISVESHFGFNVSDDTNTINGNDVALTLNYYLGLYTRASMRLTDIFTAYGLVGFTSAQLSGDTESIASGDTESSFSLGAGGMIELPFGVDGFVEVTQLVSDDNFDVLAVSFGVMRSF